jgi:GLPGLI family protein
MGIHQQQMKNKILAMKKSIFLITLGLASTFIHAQQFLNTGSIEYEVKVNVHRQNEGNEWFERFKDRIDQFSTNYYNLEFGDNKALYKFSRKGSNKRTFSFGNDEDENVWFSDYKNNTFTKLLSLDGYTLISGDLKNISWKIHPEDQRVIAGFNCRLAQTILFDSVYVFAYYTDEVNISGGPMGLHGLPGMIMGVTIPRLYASWIATGIKAAPPDLNALKSPTKGKKKTIAEIQKAVRDLAKSWGSDSKSWIDQMLWQILL